MTLLAGADGCPGGWLIVTREGRHWEAAVAPTLGGWLRTRAPAVLLVDMPIGLVESGDRPADRELRRLLGPRSSSVFPAPLRSTLGARSWEDACRRRRAIDGRAYSKQSYHLFPGIRDARRAARGAAVPVYESHPESAFAILAGAPLTASKRTQAGRRQRIRLLEAALPSCRALVRAGPPRGARWDDLLDAMALVWSAGRVVRGRERRFPAADPPPDRWGLVPMVRI